MKKDVKPIRKPARKPVRPEAAAGRRARTISEAAINTAAEAVEQLGGPIKASQALAKMAGKPLHYTAVVRWRTKGIPPEWIPWVHRATGITVTRLDPEVYPLDVMRQNRQ